MFPAFAALLLAPKGVPERALLDFAVRQWRFTPAMRIEDAYKWLFHATLGGEHAVSDDEGPRQWLDREWKTLAAPMPHEPEVVPLGPDGKLIRVNLRPYRQRHGDPEMLLAVFVSSARSFHADRSEFVRAWRSLGEKLSANPIGYLTFPEWSRLEREAKAASYPAIEHSRAYEERYRPAYRVVLRSLYLPLDGVR